MSCPQNSLLNIHTQARDMLRKCWEKNKDLLCALYPILANSTLTHPTDIFFLNALLVMPPKFRPCNYRDGMAIEHQSTVIYKVCVCVCASACV